uniref:Uncharacterized protein n=1 Tax=Panagrellus redivivus TaxID=6233 RepID=A0A7E4VT00_PANRE
MMKQLVLLAFCAAAVVYAQSGSNETVVDASNAASAEQAVEVPTSTEAEADTSVAEVEPVDSKQTASVQSAEKSGPSANDDNSGMIGSAAETVRNAASAAADSVSDAADSASEAASNAAESVANHASDAAAAVEHEASGITENAASTSFVATSLIILGLFVNTMLFA